MLPCEISRHSTQPTQPQQAIDSTNPWGNFPARWTDGHAKFSVNLSAEHPPAQLVIPIKGGPRSGSEVSILWNGTRVAQVLIAKFPHELEVDLTGLPGETVAQLEIVSSKYIPIEEEPGSVDMRNLGVMIAPMTLKW